MRHVIFLFLLALSVLFSGCMIDDGGKRHHLSLFTNTTDYTYLGEKEEAGKTWQENNETFYYTQYYDKSRVFLFDCIATVEKPRLIGGFSITNLQTGALSALPANGVRNTSYLLYRDNPHPQATTSIGISFRKEDQPTEPEIYKMQGFYVTNCRMAYIAMQQGNDDMAKFGKDDWFKLTIYNKDKSNKIEVMLGEGNELISEWHYVKLKSLGATDQLLFELSSSVGDDNPIEALTYFCLDGIVLE